MRAGTATEHQPTRGRDTKILKREIETDIAGTVFADGFERGDSSCWQAP